MFQILVLVPVPLLLLCKTRYTHSVNASCSYKVQEDNISIHMNSLLEDVALL